MQYTCPAGVTHDGKPQQVRRWQTAHYLGLVPQPDGRTLRSTVEDTLNAHDEYLARLREVYQADGHKAMIAELIR